MYYKRLLIANRGEIAVRIIRTARTLGIHTIAVYSLVDREARHVTEADEAYALLGDRLADNYLNIDALLDVAIRAEAEAIHPGYGFLAENPVFAQRCQDAGIDFVGPSPEAITLMGNKVNARNFVKSLEIPVLEGAVGEVDELVRQCNGLAYPLLVKAAAGGGGKGMRIVERPGELKNAIASTSREAQTYFGDGSVLVEKYIQNPRHIEVQVLADKHGNAIHLFERECSIQRRFQKIVEEAPSPTLSEELRQKMGVAAVRLVREMGYCNAGTVEFLVDEKLNFYFLEMNTRIQVEHPVTEMITGLDLVEEQLAIASGKILRYKQKDILRKGHAIEVRIYAEDPDQDFMPSPGEITLYQEPKGPHERIRIDSALHGPDRIHPDFDPMIAKLVVWDENRDLAREQLHYALNNYHIHGITTNILYLRSLIDTNWFQENQISTLFCEHHAEELMQRMNEERERVPGQLFAIACVLKDLEHKDSQNIWEEMGFWRQQGRVFTLEVKGRRLNVIVNGTGFCDFVIDDSKIRVEGVHIEDHQVSFELNGRRMVFQLSEACGGGWHVDSGGICHHMKRLDVLEGEDWTDAQLSASDNMNKGVVAPLPGKVVQINVKAGQIVQKGDVLLIVEAMKMENNILSPRDAEVAEVRVEVGQQVENNMELVRLEADV
ncbi:MAG: biotin carboxylase N-terminal domain-containing protein [Marinifilaceae bacterium]